MKKLIHLVPFLLMLAAGCLGQPTTVKPIPSPRSNTSGIAEDRKWEYLVISFLSVASSDRIYDPSNSLGRSKLIPFSKTGMSFDEDVYTQFAMDTLGKFGWELIAVLGTVGSKQEMLFKRPFIPNRSNEDELIKLEVERAQAERSERLKRAENSVTPIPDLIDVDAVNRIAFRDAQRTKVENRLKDVVKSLQAYPFTIKSFSYSKFSTENREAVTVELVVDATDKLLTDGNKYSSNEAKVIWLKSVFDLFEATGLERGFRLVKPGGYDVQFDLSIAVRVGGQLKVVERNAIFGYWPENVKE